MDDTTETIAAVAHHLWCRSMQGKGWRHGPAYDRDARTHDALVPFAQLGKHDRRQAVLGVRALELEQDLIGSIWYERGPARLFTAEEMRPGMRVTANPDGLDADSVGSRVDASPQETGEVIAWETDPQGWLCSVSVRWADGSVTEHHPAARELMRCGETPPHH